MTHTVQYVDASKRGDRCYENKTGWWWHELDNNCGIIETSLHGPFNSREEAVTDSYHFFEIDAPVITFDSWPGDK